MLSCFRGENVTFGANKQQFYRRLFYCVYYFFMDDTPDIFNTPILPAAYDDFWKQGDPLLASLPPRNTLIISPEIKPGSTEETTLQNIIKACKLEANDYHILFLPANQKIAWHQIRASLEPKYAVLFGIDLSDLALSVQLMPHQTGRFSNCAFIPTLSLTELEQQPDIKMHLWKYGLKPVFIDKVYG